MTSSPSRSAGRRIVQLPVKFDNGRSDEIVKDVGGSLKAVVKRRVLVGHIKPVQTIEMDEVISATGQKRLPRVMRFCLRVGEWLQSTQSMGGTWEGQALGGRPAPRL